MLFITRLSLMHLGVQVLSVIMLELTYVPRAAQEADPVQGAVLEVPD